MGDRMVYEMLPIDFNPEQLREARYRLNDEFIKKYGNVIRPGKMLTLSMPLVSNVGYRLILREEDKHGN